MIDQVKLLLPYDIKGGRENAYRRFILEEFLPKAQDLGLMPTDAWHTAYGKYPTRLIGFVADDLPPPGSPWPGRVEDPDAASA